MNHLVFYLWSRGWKTLHLGPSHSHLFGHGQLHQASGIKCPAKTMQGKVQMVSSLQVETRIQERIDNTKRELPFSFKSSQIYRVSEYFLLSPNACWDAPAQIPSWHPARDSRILWAKWICQSNLSEACGTCDLRCTGLANRRSLSLASTEISLHFISQCSLLSFRPKTVLDWLATLLHCSCYDEDLYAEFMPFQSSWLFL